jgi:tetraacyldisaccharide 4'-kinase
VKDLNWPPLVRVLLWPLSVIYGAVVRMKSALYDHGLLRQKRLKGAVVSVGNITVGGTGKTPMVIWLAEKFLAEGKRVAILSRGYHGSSGASDEVELMRSRLQNRVAFGVGKDRFAEGRRLEEVQAIDIFLLDDGFQHRQLARDVDIVLIDSSKPLGKQSVLPAGTLREPVSTSDRADLVVFTRSENAPGTRETIQKLRNLPVFSASIRLLGFRRLGAGCRSYHVDEIGRGPFFAFCGIGNPDAFFRDLRNWTVPLAGHLTFGDHHRYTDSDVNKLRLAAQKNAAKALVTTEKDEQNLAGLSFEDLPVYVAVIDLDIAPEDEFLAVLRRSLQQRTGAAA